mgnify:CR=1 FL=1
MEAGMEAAEQEDPSSMIEIEKIPRLKFHLNRSRSRENRRRARQFRWNEWGKGFGEAYRQRLASFYQVEADHVEVRMEP